MTTQSTTNPSLDFGLRLLKQEVAAATDKTKSVLLSPASVAIALAMTMNGARDTTLAGMKTTLGYDPAESIDVINASLKSLLNTLTAQDSGVELNVANAVWAEQTMPFKADFIQTVADNFDAQVTTSDFADPATKDAINAWASDKTKGKIPTIIEDISPDMVMFLLNAIYFKGPWSSKFDKSKTYVLLQNGASDFTDRAKNSLMGTSNGYHSLGDLLVYLHRNHDIEFLVANKNVRTDHYATLFPNLRTDLDKIIEETLDGILASWTDLRKRVMKDSKNYDYNWVNFFAGRSEKVDQIKDARVREWITSMLAVQTPQEQQEMSFVQDVRRLMGSLIPEEKFVTKVKMESPGKKFRLLTKLNSYGVAVDDVVEYINLLTRKGKGKSQTKQDAIPAE